MIEIIIAVAFLGVLAAFALPRFAQLRAEARAASLENLGGSLRSASAMIHALAMAQNAGAAGTVSIEGKTIQLVNGYPTAATAANNGILAALAGPGLAGYKVDATRAGPTAGAILVISNGAVDTTQCNVTYTAPVANSAPTVTVATADCT